MTRHELPSVESLRCFVAVAEQLSFRRAAAQVHLTAAALSQRIKQLEDDLGCTLLERSPRHVALTSRGGEFLVRARVALEALGHCASIGRGPNERPSLVVGTRFELGMSYLVPVVQRLANDPEPWRIHLAFGSGSEILDRLSRGTVDAIVTSAPVADERWAAAVLHKEAYVLVAAPALVGAQPLRVPSDAVNHLLIDLDRELPLARYALSACPALAFRDVWRLGTAAAVRQLVRAGQGVAVLPEYLVREDLDAGALLVLLPEVPLLADTFRLLYRRESSFAQPLEALAQLLRDTPLR